MAASGFSLSAKKEILGHKLRSRSERTAFLWALVHTAGSIIISSEGLELVVATSNKLIKQTIDEILFDLYKEKSGKIGGKIVIAGSFLQKLLADLGLLKAGGENGVFIEPGIETRVVPHQSAKTAYAKGAFLGAGSVSVKSGYHLEIAVSNKKLSHDLEKLFGEFGAEAKTAARNDSFILYFKGIERVSDVLAFLGAPKAVLELNNMYAGRQVKKEVNRAANCDIANIDRSLNAAKAQTDAIEKLIKNQRLTPDSKLYATAAARLANPDITMEELAAKLGITKSGLSHRLKRLMLLAESI